MVNTALKRLSFSTGSIFKTQNTILSAAFILAVAGGVNAVLGLVKGRLLTHYFGVSPELSVFYTADRIPNLIYSVLVLGALSTVFIPVFTELMTKDKKEAWVTASSIINVCLAVFVFLALIIFIFAPQIIRLISVNKFDASEVFLGAGLMRIMLTAQLILVISSFVTSILHSFKYFLIPALSPIMYSLGMVFGIIALTSRFGIYGPALGVVVGAMLHLVIQVPLLRNVEFSYHMSFSLNEKKIREAFALMPPRIGSVLIANLVSTIDNSLAILVSTTSVVYLKFANQLQFFPVSLFAVSMASAMLPTLARKWSEKNVDKFKSTFLVSLHQMLFLVIPASVLLLVLRVPIVRLVYGVSNFPWEATVKTSYTLAFFSLSIVAQSSLYLLTRAFYALKDTFTPVKVSVVTLLFNVALSLIFIKVLNFGVWSIALSFSMMSFLDATVLLWLLSRKLGGFNWNDLLIPFTKISYAAVMMGISLYVPLKLLDNYVFDTTRTVGLLILTGIVTLAGVVSYLVFTRIFKVEEVQLFYTLLRRLRTNFVVDNIPETEQPQVDM